MSVRSLTLRCVVAMLALGASVTVVSAQMMSLSGKFEAASTGAATYSIPIAVPPGTAGMVPALTLQYSSQGGNGIVGVGWSLGGLLSISRCPRNIVQDGVMGTVNYDANDRFCMDGQRLVAVSGAYGANGTEYRTEIESFNRVISQGTAGTGPASFEVRTKSGQIMFFGTTADSRPMTSTGTSRSWLLSKIQDSKGNYLTVQYTNDATNGQAYPTRIDYTGNTAAGLAPYNSVQFVYETRPDIVPSYHAGSMTRTTVRMTNIQTYAGSTLVSNYVLAYQQGPLSLRSRLTSVTLCAAGGACLPATSFAWTNGGTGSFTEFSGPIGYDFGAPPQSTWTPISGDFNGDGKSDFLLVKNSTIETFLSNGDRSFTRIEQAIGINLGSPPAAIRNLVVGDFNADGKTDFIFDGLDQINTFLSNGDGTFTRVVQSITYEFSSPGNYYLVIGDFNFDGRTDFGLISWDMFTQFFSAGNGTFTRSDVYLGAFFAAGNWTFLPGDFNSDGRGDFTVVGNNGFNTYLGNENGTFYVVNQAFCCWGTPATANWTPFVGDFNGDGKTDFALVSGINFNTFLGKGEGTFARAYQSIAPGTLLVPPSAYFATISGDINGDGKSDITFLANNVISTFISKGDGTFTNIGQNIATNHGSPPSSWLVFSLDYRGIGRSDIIALSGGTIVGYEGGGGASDLLASITTGLGATTSLTYTPLTQSSVYAKETTAAYPLQDMIGPAYVISRVDTSNGIGGTYSTTYRYVGAKGDVAGRGYLGFRQMIATDLQTNLIQTTTFRQDFPYIGMVASKTTFAGAQALRSTSNGYELRNVSGAATVSAPSVTSAPYRVLMTSNTESSADLDGTAIPTVTTTTQYDAFNNPTQVVVSTPDGYSKTTSNTYTNDTTNWYLGRLTRAGVASQAPAPPPLPGTPVPDLTVSKTHAGSFVQGLPGGTYSVTVTNSGTAPTSGTVTVTDTLPSGLAATAISGAGWSCTLATTSCTRSDALAAGASYPAITLTVNAAANAPALVTNVASVSGGGEANTSNNAANDSTTIVQSVSIQIQASTNNVNLWDYLVARGAATPGTPGAWNVTIAGGVIIGSASTSVPAFDTGIFPSGSTVQIINNGTIVGAGGGGGNAGYCSFQVATAGAPGGLALRAQVAATIANNGSIWGGGGGGGGGGTGRPAPARFNGGGGGGGGAGSSPGVGGVSGGSGGFPGCTPSAATAGTLSDGGAGGSANCTAGSGGSGGGPGQAGQAGVQGNSSAPAQCASGVPAGGGGAAGAAVNGNSLITWTNVGDRRGAVN